MSEQGFLLRLSEGVKSYLNPLHGIKEEIRYIRNELKMRLMQSDTYVRAHEDLRRAFSTTLQEYRKYQD